MSNVKGLDLQTDPKRTIAVNRLRAVLQTQSGQPYIYQ